MGFALSDRNLDYDLKSKMLIFLMEQEDQRQADQQCHQRGREALLSP